MFWSLIPWRDLLKLALPFIREVFVGKFNFKGYFVKHPAITLCIIVITLATMSMLFMTEQAMYHATKSVEYKALLSAEQAKVKALNNKVKDLAKTKPPPHVLSVQAPRKEVVLVQPAKPVQHTHLTTSLPKPTTPKPIVKTEYLALPVNNYPTIKDKLHALDEDN